MSQRVFVVGGAITSFIGKHHPDFVWKKHPDFGKRENPSLEQTLHKAALDALEATGVPASSVERAYVGNFAGELFSSQGHLGAMLAAASPGLAYLPAMRVEGACASGGLAFLAGVDAIRAGANVVLVVGAEVQTTVGARKGAEFLARAAHFAQERAIDEFTFPCMFARRARHYFASSDATAEDTALVVAKAYACAAKNPLAHMHTRTLTLEQARDSDCFLANEEYKSYLRLSDCSQVSDGGAALVLVSERGLQKLEKQADALELIGAGHACGPLGNVADLTWLDVTARAASRAYSQAGLAPSDVQVAEVHDCFSVTELLMYEALGFAARGRGAELVREGATDLTGRIPVNTGGGLIAYGHPVGATGVKQILEIWKQTSGKAGAYQLAQPPQIGLCANMGGDDRTSVVTIFRK